MEGQKGQNSKKGTARQSDSVIFSSKNIYKTRAGQASHDLRNNLNTHTRQHAKRHNFLANIKLPTLNRRQKLLGLIIIICLIACLAAVIFSVFLRPQSTADGTDDIDDTPVEESAIAVEKAYADGGYDAMIAEYQRLIDNTNDNTEKSGYYADRADYVSALYEANTVADPDAEDPAPIDNDLATKYKSQILADALKAEELAPSSVTALALYYYYDLFGDTDNSDHYKQVALERDPKAIEEDNNDNES